MFTVEHSKSGTVRFGYPVMFESGGFPESVGFQSDSICIFCLRIHGSEVRRGFIFPLVLDTDRRLTVKLERTEKKKKMLLGLISNFHLLFFILLLFFFYFFNRSFHYRFLLFLIFQPSSLRKYLTRSIKILQNFQVTANKEYED